MRLMKVLFYELRMNEMKLLQHRRTSMIVLICWDETVKRHHNGLLRKKFISWILTNDRHYMIFIHFLAIFGALDT